MIDNELIKELAVIAQGRYPAWKAGSVVSVPSGPPSGSNGWETAGAIITVGLITLNTATTVDATIWLQANGNWYTMRGGKLNGLTENWTERIITAGFTRIFIEINSTDGEVVTNVGPCELEP